ncbi:hypothetical protein CONCODRAFT_13959 [Conidiobolus coronatus NRRL 28638]|uniref:Secreted protein n=1 Tax=Conidiobolus coronatus (strain ATCC 28846 / CBS 209.66 / NRRL 28638) TaxID=796925 RepID=A0A137NPV4_CONC2|nr:hypothetical protein CONCODRAFT_13959 [Conidiobolus coronatus NRRL 28638]|eukprot:KXN64768.1 hypothetical protein CONCODRAFT_13959 [Conidiobolus coronatus NRRL 28638]
MKFQLLATLLIASVASNPIRSFKKPYPTVRKPLYSVGAISNFGSSDQYNSENYEASQLSEEDSLEEQNLEYQNDLADLFNQIEELNSIVEEGGDNFNMGSLKNTAKKVWNGAKKVYNSPVGQAAVGVAKVLL